MDSTFWLATKAKVPGCGIRPLSSRLRAPKDCTLKWIRNSGTLDIGFCLTLLRTAGLLPWQKEKIVFEMGVCHSPRPCSI